MKLLILGGTIFLGRHLVAMALARGHEVTLFNRGRHNPDLFPDVEKLRGDREGDLDALWSIVREKPGQVWDGVIDTCGYVPRQVRASAELLAGTVGHYTFISSISVYADFPAEGIDETGPLQTLADPTVEAVSGETYGGLKALCERAAADAMPGRVLNVRAGLIVGPYDTINRFPYWLKRIKRGGEVLAPGQPDRPVQIIDVRDLADWTIRAVEANVTGTYNVTGPPNHLTLGHLLGTIRTISDSQASLTWVEDQFLIEQQVQPFDGLPFWVPAEAGGLFQVKVERALATGLTLRPITETVTATLAWLEKNRAAEPDAMPLQLYSGLTLEREAEILAAWHTRYK